MKEDPDCLFCGIINKKISANIIAENEHVIAFSDINPVATTHILIVPKIHIKNVNEFKPEQSAFFSSMLVMAQELADRFKAKLGYRLVINNGEHAGQSVFHLHMHLLAGRDFSWPPG